MVVEGVETRRQRDFLAAHCCDEIQGYRFSKPLPPPSLVTLLAGNQQAPTLQIGDFLPALFEPSNTHDALPAFPLLKAGR